MFYIPGLYQLVAQLRNDDYYEIFCLVNIVVAIILFFYFFKHPLRYGKFYTPVKGEILIEDKFACMTPNLLCAFFFTFTGQIFREFWLLAPPAIFFILFHVLRACLSMKRSKYSHPWPLKVVIYTSVYKSITGILAARAFVDGDFYPTLANWIKFAGLFIVTGFQIYFDMTLTKLRFHGDRGYRIPVAGLGIQNKISCPSYLCELFIWIMWSSMFSLDFGIIAILVWLLPNVYGRAEVTHRWYLRVFRNTNYPKDRTAVIPYVDMGKVLTGVIGTMEYGGF